MPADSNRRDAGMNELPVIVHTRDRFRIEGRDAGNGALHYVIVDTAGVVLWRESSLDDAKAWIDRRIGDCTARAPVPQRRHR